MADFAVGPPLPPELAVQQSPPGRAPVFMQAGEVGGDPVSLLEAKLAELETWASDMNTQLEIVDPPAQAFLVPIAQAGQALKNRIQQLRDRVSGGPTGGGPVGIPNPAEGAPVRPPV